MTLVSVLIVDDQAPFLRAMSAVIEETEGFRVVGRAGFRRGGGRGGPGVCSPTWC